MAALFLTVEVSPLPSRFPSRRCVWTWPPSLKPSFYILPTSIFESSIHSVHSARGACRRSGGHFYITVCTLPLLGIFSCWNSKITKMSPFLPQRDNKCYVVLFCGTNICYNHYVLQWIWMVVGLGYTVPPFCAHFCTCWGHRIDLSMPLFTGSNKIRSKAVRV